MLRAVDMATELATLLTKFADACQRENLETSGIRQDRAVPCVELMQSARLTQNVKPRTQIQVVGVTQNNLSLHLFTQL